MKPAELLAAATGIDPIRWRYVRGVRDLYTEVTSDTLTAYFWFVAREYLIFLRDNAADHPHLIIKGHLP